MLEFIRKMLLRKFHERKEEYAKWDYVIPSRVNAKVLKNSGESRILTIISAWELEYEVFGPCGLYVVKLRQYSYGGGSWQKSSIPCSHAMVTTSLSCGRDLVKDRATDYVHQSLSINTYLQTYKGMIHPIPQQKMWLEIERGELLPPPFQTQPDKPKLQRLKEPDEKAK
ncbi:hypothetical protein Ddye_001496 [Dipteronia dyeriana]|uniref:Uncharacterized protein n=1 Tax=Dipteronia dyeriana TaxID=168575 RepID=A0AAE0CTI6_9ROSI|nr:hypothetical protein Ddye_001496 [Dipteronia dyeriana]